MRHGRRSVLHGHLGTVVGVGRVDVDDPGIQPRYVAAQGRTGGGEGQVDVGPVFAAALPDQALVGQFDGLRAVAQARVVGRLPGGVAQGVVELHLDLCRLLQGDPQDRALEALAVAVEGAALLLQLLLALFQFGGAVVQLALLGEQAFEVAFGQLQQALQLVDAGHGAILAGLGAAALDVGEELLLRFEHAAAVMDFPQLPVYLAQLLVELLHTVVVRALDPLRGAADVEQGGGGAGAEDARRLASSSWKGSCSRAISCWPLGNCRRAVRVTTARSA